MLAKGQRIGRNESPLSFCQVRPIICKVTKKNSKILLFGENNLSISHPHLFTFTLFVLLTRFGYLTVINNVYALFGNIAVNSASLKVVDVRLGRRIVGSSVSDTAWIAISDAYFRRAVPSVGAVAVANNPDVSC